MSSKLKASPAVKQSSQQSPEQAQPTPDNDLGKNKFGLILLSILLLAGAAYLSLAFNWPKFSRAEVFFAECVREMFQADNLVTPLYHGTPFFDKPILAYWFIAASYKVFGISHFAARIPAVLMALATVAITAWSGRALYGARQGLAAAAVLASSLMYISFANLCMSDMNLVLFDTLSLALLYVSTVNDKQRSTMLYLASLSMGLAFLTKGPVGLVLPAVSFAAYLSISKQWNKISFLNHVIPCTLILLGAGVPWFMAAFRQNGAGALSYFFIHENLQRFAGSTYDTHRPIWFMVQSLLSGMLPWSVFLPFVAADSLKIVLNKGNSTSGRDARAPGDDYLSAANGSLANDRLYASNGLTASNGPSAINSPSATKGLSTTDAQTSSKQKQIYLWLWVAVVTGFFSLSRGKIDYYVLPAYPAAAILIGNYIVSASDSKSKVLTSLAWIFTALAAIAGTASLFVLPTLFAKEGIGAWPVMPAILLCSAAAMIYFSCKKQAQKTFAALFTAVCLLAVSFSYQIYPWITDKQAVLKYVPFISAVGTDTRIGVYTSLQNWIDEITFQTDTEPMKIEKLAMAEQFLKARSPSLLLIQQSEYAQLSEQTRQNTHLIASNAFIPRSLNPVYFMSKGQKLADQSKLLLVANFEPSAKSASLLKETLVRR